MREPWTGDLIGRMHNEHITYDDLAAEMGVGKAYLSMILNGWRSPAGAEQRLNAAYYAVLAKRKAQKSKSLEPSSGIFKP